MGSDFNLGFVCFQEHALSELLLEFGELGHVDPPEHDRF